MKFPESMHLADAQNNIFNFEHCILNSAHGTHSGEVCGIIKSSDFFLKVFFLFKDRDCVCRRVMNLGEPSFC